MMDKMRFKSQVSYCLAMSYIQCLLDNGFLSESEMATAEESLFKSENPLVRQVSIGTYLT
jgi:hypothetical protein